MASCTPVPTGPRLSARNTEGAKNAKTLPSPIPRSHVPRHKSEYSTFRGGLLAASGAAAAPLRKRQRQHLTHNAHRRPAATCPRSEARAPPARGFPEVPESTSASPTSSHGHLGHSRCVVEMQHCRRRQTIPPLECENRCGTGRGKKSSLSTASPMAATRVALLRQAMHPAPAPPPGRGHPSRTPPARGLRQRRQKSYSPTPHSHRR